MRGEDRAGPFNFAALGFDLPARPEQAQASKADRLRKMHADPEFAAARDERGRERFKARRAEMQRLSNAARRGYDVPPAKEAEWKALKRKRTLSNAEIARLLGLKKWRKPKGKKASK